MFFENLSRKFLFDADKEAGAGTSTEETETAGESTETESTENVEDEIVVIKGKEYKASELLGADGIPRAKNLSVELERKNRELQEQKDLLKGIIQQPQQIPQVDPQKQFEGIVNAVKSKYPNVDEETARMAVEISQGMVQAGNIARAPIDAEYFLDREKALLKSAKPKDPNDAVEVARVKSDQKVLSDFEDQVDEAWAAMPMNWKSNPQVAKQAIRNAVDVVKGRNFDAIQDARSALENRGNVRPRDTSVTSGGGSRAPKGAGTHGAGLTDSQKLESEKMDIPESSYRPLLKKAQERDKAAGKPPRQTLN